MRKAILPLLLVAMISAPVTTNAAPSPILVAASHGDGSTRPDGLYSVLRDGSRERRLAEEAFFGVWGQTRDILIYGYPDAGTGRLQFFLLEVSTGTTTRLTRGRPENKYAPALSPDGTRLAYCGNRDGPRDSEIYVADLATGRRERLTTNATEDCSPTWSPSGNRIMWSHGWHLWTMSPHGGNKQPFRARGEPRAVAGRDPDWSPGGTRIAYVCDTSICVIRADGSNRRKIAWGASFSPYLSTPTWSPNGRLIAYTRSKYDSVLEDFRDRVFTIHPSGMHARFVINDAVNQDW